MGVPESPGSPFAFCAQVDEQFLIVPRLYAEAVFRQEAGQDVMPRLAAHKHMLACGSYFYASPDVFDRDYAKASDFLGRQRLIHWQIWRVYEEDELEDLADGGSARSIRDKQAILGSLCIAPGASAKFVLSVSRPDTKRGRPTSRPW